ncbi:VWA domain-containing protein [Ferroplasma sp.]|uniref:vWA domain-containing protein n=1 Tax=Ferroplasma sp. TaxID=2591003 RepID=UPI002637065F|nr:VWA domain-containing protein [Ferroplasma sp.]
MAGNSRSNINGISQTSTVYKITRERLVRRVNIDLDKNSAEDIKTAASDLYFLFYSGLVTVKNQKNSNEFMESIRLRMDYMTKTKEFTQAKTYSHLNDRLSMLYSINFMKALNENAKKNAARNGNTSESLNPKTIEKSMEGASKKIEMAHEIEKIIKDKNPGGNTGRKEGLSVDSLIDLTDKAMKVENADKILTMANKLIDIMPRYTKKMRAFSNTGELAGYYKTRHISNVLSRELAMPDEIFYSKIINGFTGKEKRLLSPGAYYVLLDKSGSMYEGDKTLWSRSVALALFRISKNKGRKYFFRFFDNKPHDLLNSPFDIVENILTVEANKGTCIECALKTALRDLQDGKMASETNTIIIITDGEDKVNMQDYFRKENETKLITVMINGYNEGLKKISTTYMDAKLSESGALELLGLARSV